jgi:cation transport protein ChaC
VRALAFTLSRRSPNYTGLLSPERYRRIFSCSAGRYGTTLAYARETYEHLRELGVHDRALAELLSHAPDTCPT